MDLENKKDNTLENLGMWPGIQYEHQTKSPNEIKEYFVLKLVGNIGES